MTLLSCVRFPFSPSGFLDNLSPCAHAALPPHRAKELTILIGTGDTAASLFQACTEGIVAEKLAKRLQQEVKDFFTGSTDKITRWSFNGLLSKCCDIAEEMDGTEVLPSARAIKEVYMGLDIDIMIDTLRDEAATRCHVWLRAVATKKQLANAFWGQSVVLDGCSDEGVPSRDVDVQLLTQMKASRSLLASKIGDLTTRTADVVSACVLGLKSDLAIKDPYSRVDQACLNQILAPTKGTTAKLLTKASSMLPSSTNYVHPSKVVAALDALVAGEMFTLSQRGDQEQCKMIVGLVRDVQDGQALKVGSLPEDPFLANVITRMHFFATSHAEYPVDHSKVKGPIGIPECWEQHFASIEALIKSKTAKRMHLNQIKTCSYAMTPAEASKAKNLVKNVDNLTATVGRAAMSTPAKKRQGEAEQSSSSKARKEEAQEAARNIFATRTRGKSS